ncbi:MAG: DUF3667 domain-containing protein [Saprospiraceae bacterium]
MTEIKPSESIEQACRNCQAPLPPNSYFCPNCGQRNTDGRVTFRELIGHFFESILNFDGRIFQTIAALAVPGKLTKNFFEGKHIRYYHPVRLFILSGALFIAMLSIVVSKSKIDEVDKVWKIREQSYFIKKVITEIDTISLDVEQEINEPIVAIAFDSLQIRFAKNHQSATKDSVEISEVVNFGNSGRQAAKKVALNDLINMNGDALADKYGVKGLWERQIFLQNIRIQKSLKNFLFYTISNILWMVLLMMPMLALVLKLLYIRHPYLYIEHLIFSFHTHTFLFLFYSLLLMLGLWVGYELLSWALLLLAVYLFFAMKRFYGQGWGKTILKFLLTNIFYLGVMAVAMIIMALVSVFLF